MLLPSDLPEAPLAVEHLLFDPTTGRSSRRRWNAGRGGPATRIDLDPFRHDVVIRLTGLHHDAPSAMSVLCCRAFRGEENAMKLILIGCEYAGTTALAIAFHDHARAHLGIELGS